MITLESLAREAGYFCLPEGGAWVAIKGCPLWPRGKRLIKAHREIGIRHMDIYWADSEKFALDFGTVNRTRRRYLPLPDAIYYDVSQGKGLEEAKERAIYELRQEIDRAPFASHYQYTLIAISHPHVEKVQFYNGEIAVYTDELIRELLAENALDVIHFGQTEIPILEDAAREITDALQLDGYSAAQAYQEVLTSGFDDKMKTIAPQWFYRPKGWYRDAFCEEEDK